MDMGFVPIGDKIFTNSNGSNIHWSISDDVFGDVWLKVSITAIKPIVKLAAYDIK